MVGHADGGAAGLSAEQIAQVWPGLRTHPGAQAQHLVEVAVIQITLPIHAEQAAAHHGGQVVWPVAAFEQLQIALERALGHQGAAKALDGHVGQRKQVIEGDAKVAAQLTLVVGLQPGLWWWQHGALWVVDEVEHQPGGRVTVAQRIERLQALDAALKHAVTTLPVHIGGRITGQRRDHIHPLVGQKLRQVGLAGLGQDGEVAAVNHRHAQRPGGHHQAAEMRVELRRAAGQIQRLDAARLQHLQHQVDRAAVHLLSAVGAGVDMAVQAALVAAVAQVDLQRVQALARDGRKVSAGQQVDGGVHGRLKKVLPQMAAGRGVDQSCGWPNADGSSG